MKKKGFTLGEILITLTIVGVVAILTIPSMINDINDKGRMNLLKGTLSDVNNAIQSYMIKNHMTDLEDMEISPKNGVPFLFTHKYKGEELISDTEYIATKKDDDGFIKKYNFADLPDEKYTVLSGSEGSEIASDDLNTQYVTDGDTAILNNGVAIALSGKKTSDDINYYSVLIDLNGVDAPNVVGMDVFFAYLISNNVPAKNLYAGDIVGSLNPDVALSDMKTACKTSADFSGACFYMAEQSGFDSSYYKNIK